MNYQQSLHNVLSDPSFQPPEDLFELNLKGNFQDLLKSHSKKVCAKFAISEARLVLPIFEAKYPDDSRPRDQIAAEERKWRPLNDKAIHYVYDRAVWAYAANTAYHAYYAAYYVYSTDPTTITNTAYHASNAATNAQRADSSITLSDQLRRLLNLGRV